MRDKHEEKDDKHLKTYAIVIALIIIIVGGFFVVKFFILPREEYPEGAPQIHNPIANYQNITRLEPATEDHHSGIHFITNTTKIIRAPFDGKVEHIEYNHTTGYEKDGEYIKSNGFSFVLRYNKEYFSNPAFEFFHPDGYLSEEYIRSKVYVSKGEWVEQGDPLGKIVNFSQDTHVCWPVWHDKNPETSDVEINKSWCMFTSMAPGLAEELDTFYQNHREIFNQDHICWCWDEHKDQIN